jgi:hypothetical protein
MEFINFNDQVAEFRATIVSAIESILKTVPDCTIEFIEDAPHIKDDDIFEIDGLNGGETLIKISLEGGVETVETEYGLFDLGTDDLVSLYEDVWVVAKRFNGK